MFPRSPRISRYLKRASKNVLFERNTTHPPHGFMPLGSFSYSNGPIRGLSRVGRYCSLADNIQVMGDNHPTQWISTSPWQYSAETPNAPTNDVDVIFNPERFRSRPFKVSIGDGVWIGQNVILKGGVHIGTGSIIAAGGGASLQKMFQISLLLEVCQQ